MEMSPSRRQKLRRAAALTVVLYLLVMIFGGCADRMILLPPKGHIDAGPARRTSVTSKVGDVEVWTARSQSLGTRDPHAFVLEFTGNATRAEQIAQFVADRWQNYPIEAWTMNYPGYGANPGTSPHLKDIPPAALATFDHLKSIAGDRPIFLEANSLGTTAALYVAAHRAVAGLVLQNPPPLQRLILGRYGWWNLWLVALPVSLQTPSELDSMANARHASVPAVFLTATNDTLVPPGYQKLVIEAYAGTKRVIEMNGASHWSSVTGNAERDLEQQIDWLWKTAVH